MNPKAYPQEKRLKIIQLPNEELSSFLKEISSDFLRDFAQRFPTVDGFRQGNHTELHMRIKRYIAKMRSWNDKEWMYFQDLWIGWIKTHPQLEALLSKYDNSADFAEDGEVPPNSDLDIKCFENLAQKSEESRISKELIKRFYDFGYFKEDPTIECIIAMAKSAAELRLLELPEEIENIRSEYRKLESSVEVLSSRLNTSIRDSGKALGLVDRIDKTDSTIKEIQKKILDLFKDNVNFRENLQQFAKELVDFVCLYNSLENTLLDRGSQIFDEKFIQFKSDLIKNIEDLCCQLDLAMDLLSQEVINLRDEVMQKEQESANTLIPIEIQKTDKFIAVEDLSVEASIEELNSQDNILSLLIENFRNVGMQSVVARVLAGEMLAALSAGQIVLFKGSMASIITEVCARTLAGSSTRKVYIPIGLLDGREFSNTLHQIIKDSKEKNMVNAFVIEGINLSAPEVYAGSLRHLIGERFLGLDTNRNLILFGTILEGPTALTSPELCELGPVFHTDCLKWRDKWSHRLISAGIIPCEVWNTYISTNTDMPDNWEDVYKDYIHLGGHETVLWHRCIYTAATRLSGRGNDGNVPTLAQSLVFGWLLPRALALRANSIDFENDLASGRLDASNVDERIVKLFGYFNR